MIFLNFNLYSGEHLGENKGILELKKIKVLVKEYVE
jgi:hypothetical protein